MIFFLKLRGHLGENGQNYQISVFCSKSVFRYGGITFQIFRVLAALEPPPKWGAEGGGFPSFFFVFNRKRKRKWKKYFVHFVGNLSRISKLFFFSFQHKNWGSSILFYIYLYIFKKLSPKWEKVFLFRFYILCENFSKIGP